MVEKREAPEAADEEPEDLTEDEEEVALKPEPLIEVGFCKLEVCNPHHPHGPCHGAQCRQCSTP